MFASMFGRLILSSINLVHFSLGQVHCRLVKNAGHLACLLAFTLLFFGALSAGDCKAVEGQGIKITDGARLPIPNGIYIYSAEYNEAIPTRFIEFSGGEPVFPGSDDGPAEQGNFPNGENNIDFDVIGSIAFVHSERGIQRGRYTITGNRIRLYFQDGGPKGVYSVSAWFRGMAALSGEQAEGVSTILDFRHVYGTDSLGKFFDSQTPYSFRSATGAQLAALEARRKADEEAVKAAGFVALSEGEMTWDEAVDYCRQQGGRLPLINDLGNGLANFVSRYHAGIFIEGFGIVGGPWPTGLPAASYFTGTFADYAISFGDYDDILGDNYISWVGGIHFSARSYPYGSSGESRLHRALCVPRDGFTLKEGQGEDKPLGIYIHSAQQEMAIPARVIEFFEDRFAAEIGGGECIDIDYFFKSGRYEGTFRIIGDNIAFFFDEHIFSAYKYSSSQNSITLSNENGENTYIKATNERLAAIEVAREEEQYALEETAKVAGFIALSRGKMTWPEAVAYCRQHGGRLPLINGSYGNVITFFSDPVDGFGTVGGSWPASLPKDDYWTGTAGIDSADTILDLSSDDGVSGCGDYSFASPYGGEYWPDESEIVYLHSSSQSWLRRTVCVPGEQITAEEAVSLAEDIRRAWKEQCEAEEALQVAAAQAAAKAVGFIALANSPQTWSEADEYCRQQGGRLPLMETWFSPSGVYIGIHIDGFGYLRDPWPADLPLNTYWTGTGAGEKSSDFMAVQNLNGEVYTTSGNYNWRYTLCVTGDEAAAAEARNEWEARRAEEMRERE